MPSLPRYAASTTRNPMPSARSTSPDPVSSAALCRYVLRLLIRRPLPLLMGMRVGGTVCLAGAGCNTGPLLN